MSTFTIIDKIVVDKNKKKFGCKPFKSTQT